MSDDGPAGDPGPTRHRARSDQPTPTAGKVRWLYLMVERRSGYAPNPGLLRLLVRIAFLLGGTLVTAVTVLVTVLTGHAVATGLAIGLLLSVLLVVLAVGYVLWGGLVGRWGRQQRR